MDRRRSTLLSFLIRALESKKYENLRFENVTKTVFSLTLPRKTRSLDEKYEQLLKDWREQRSQPYSYSDAKQSILSTLKANAFLKVLARGEKLVFQILSDAEAAARKSEQEALIAGMKNTYNQPKVKSSSDDCGEGFVANLNKMENSNATAIGHNILTSPPHSALPVLGLSTDQSCSRPQDNNSVRFNQYFRYAPFSIGYGGKVVDPNDVLPYPI